MSDIEKIKAEIERRIENYWSDGDVDSVVVSGELEELIDFINSLPEEFPPYCTGVKGDPDPAGISDLEEAADKYIQGSLCDLDDGPTVGLAKEAFIAGAEYQKGQMTKDAVENRRRKRQ